MKTLVVELNELNNSLIESKFESCGLNHRKKIRKISEGIIFQQHKILFPFSFLFV